MKKVVMIGLLVAGLGGQAFSMGHPHNMFAARKHLKKQSAALPVKPKAETLAYWENTVQLAKHALCELFVVAVSHVHPVQLY